MSLSISRVVCPCIVYTTYTICAAEREQNRIENNVIERELFVIAKIH